MLYDRSKPGQELDFINENILILPGVDNYGKDEWLRLAARHKNFFGTSEISKGLALREVADYLPEEFKSKYATSAMAIMALISELSEIKSATVDPEFFRTLLKTIRANWREFYEQTTNYFRKDYFDQKKEAEPATTGENTIPSEPGKDVLPINHRDIKF